MSFAKRFRSGAVAAATLLAVLLLSSSVVLADVITTDTSASGATYDGATQDFSTLTDYVYVTITTGLVSGSGLSIVGKTDPTASDVGLSYLFSEGTIRVPVTFSVNLVPNSAFVFSSSTVDMTDSAANAFVFAQATFTANTSFTFTGLTATWPAGGTGSLVSAQSTFAVAQRSAIFIEDSTVTNARSVLYVSAGASQTATISGGSVVAIDEVKCVSCSSAVARMVAPLTVSDSSLFRVRLCDAGAMPLITASDTVTVSGNSLMGVTDSNSTGALFAFDTVALSGGSALTFKNLTGGSTGLSSDSPIPTSASTDSTTYGDSACVFGGTAMTSTDSFLGVGLKVSSFAASSTCTSAGCVPGLSTGVNSTAGCVCLCETGTYQPYCTYMSDPLASAISGGSSCKLFKCTQCSSTQANTCEGCEQNYVLTSGACVRSCAGSNCAACGDDGVCTACNTGYQLQSDATCILCNIPNCATCSSAGTCSACSSGYSLYNNTCVPCGITNCATCTTDNVCSACNSGYSVSSSGDSCISCNVPNCVHCSTVDKCDTCDTSTSRYTLTSSGTCVLCSVSNCQTCETANVCSACISSKYTLSNGACIPCNVDRCLACAKENVCSECDSAYKLSTTGQCYTCPSTCNSCSSDNTCAVCSAGYNLVNDVCVECSVDYCLECNATNSCKTCSTGRTPDSTGACVLDVACATGYYKDTDGNCKPNCNIAYCSSCSAPNVCSTCEGNLVLSSDRKSCACNTASCATCNSDRCTACLSGYKLTSGYLCVRITSAVSSPLSVIIALVSFLGAVLAAMSL